MNDIAMPTTESKTTVTYLRTASSDQADSRLGLERQLRDCEDYARSLGVRITRTYADVGVSGLREDRPALAQLLRDLSRGGIGRVIVADPARLARSRQLEQRLQERIRSQGATLTMPCDTIDRSSDSN
jgi:DNA invertase Pin-like site-specific DNA recombinase